MVYAYIHITKSIDSNNSNSALRLCKSLFIIKINSINTGKLDPLYVSDSDAKSIHFLFYRYYY